MKRNQLTARFAQSVRDPGKYQDGAGLMLVVTRSGGRQWVQRVTIQGRRRDIGLGSATVVSLKDARAAADANRAIARDGGDPTIEPIEPDRIPTFGEVFEAVIELKRRGWKRSGKTEGQWRASIRDYAGALVAMPVDEIRTEHVIAALAPIWHDKHETATRVKQRIGEVLEWAIAHDHRVDNPAQRVTRLLGSNGHLRQHHRALAYGRVSGALAAIRESGAWWATKAAFEFLVLTGTRSGEVRGATWSEIDEAAAVWTIPAARTKVGREHRVPLSRRALAVLTEARELTGGAGLVFPSMTGRIMSDSTVSKLLRENGIEAVPHGFRSSFRQWAAERTNTPREVAEFALAHVVGDAAERAYQRGDLFDKRRDLMNQWAAYLARDSRTNVIRMRA